ncbi:glutaredoxin family protein [Saliterribacillus persicus]|uniref:Glutaredoxin-like protein DUF836 n=1 Tax=Saliterribacillus persicus TaxID=930114 RepID=A0A368XLY3_9BACI|nr:glutaredoxin family protein [Saliterribacillus persicus]RCW67044.1 glutaredoxin-like protein DUF836 [Saliterribacillus persicus]
MQRLYFYTKENCGLCEEAKTIVELLQAMHHFEIIEIDIYKEEKYLEKYQLMIPVIEIDNQVVAYGNISYESIEQKLKAGKNSEK